ncbi:carbonic anhydrase [Silvimonas terrae]|uniref:carbonic anhydrase n=1 Tax=Silvimonas terrae TaxID=300266 RepID=A0A840RC34_9NEIS|nr:carbonic anhydrase family protein [Silvimonas terrae]MBB5190507.1 carbonic anhydrase [Silvimonas terrae]
MLKKSILALLLASAASLVTAASPHWTYEGAEGPASWGHLSQDFHLCEQGRAESPIDITNARKAPVNTPRIQFNYGPLPVHLLNTGHAMQFVAAPDKDSVTLGDTSYKLQQFHFHSPGEERFAGKSSPLDMHLVHASAQGKLLVVAVQFELADESNPVLQTLEDLMPQEHGAERLINSIQIDPAALLPANSGYYTYSGSLTTPPCSEGVTWVELKQPVKISKAQLEKLQQFYDHNQRPVQPLNGREILEVDPE